MGNMLRDETKEILRKHEVRLSKKAGQSHLVDEGLIRRITHEYAEISSSDKVLEIGPGIGNLTSFLIEEARMVFAVERDERLVKILKERLGGSPNIDIIQGDILEIDLPNFDKVVSNLPYSISTPITFKLFEENFQQAVLMYQKEFAERMVASPGSSEYSRLSVGISYGWDVRILEEVSPDSFIPQPEVSSAIVEVKPQGAKFQVDDEELFHNSVKAAFQHRRQKTRNSLYHSFEEIFPDLEVSDDEKRNIIDDNLPEELANARPGNLAPEDFGKIADCLSKISKD